MLEPQVIAPMQEKYDLLLPWVPVLFLYVEELINILIILISRLTSFRVYFMLGYKIHWYYKQVFYGLKLLVICDSV